jgi:hypothetical protein
MLPVIQQVVDFFNPGMIQQLSRAAFQTVQLCIEARYLLRLLSFNLKFL